MLTFAIGDIHGCFAPLLDLVGQCEAYAREADQPAKFVFLGDYVDRGPESAQVVEFLIDRVGKDDEMNIALMGNHDEMFINRATAWPLDAPEDEPYFLPTWRSFENHPSLHHSAAVEFLAKRPYYHADGLRFFVHAGVRPGVPLWEQSKNDLTWIREEFLFSDAVYERYIVHGHTPMRPLEVPKVLDNRLNIDTGACWPQEGGKLTAAVFNTTGRCAIDFLQAQMPSGEE